MNVWRKAICVSISASTPMAHTCVTAMKAMMVMDALAEVLVYRI